MILYSEDATQHQTEVLSVGASETRPISELDQDIGKWKTLIYQINVSEPYGMGKEWALF